GQVDIAEMARIDPKSGPGLAVTFGRRVVAERKNAGAKDGTVARQDQFPPQNPTGVPHRISSCCGIVATSSAFRLTLLTGRLPTQAVSRPQFAPASGSSRPS